MRKCEKSLLGYSVLHASRSRFVFVFLFFLFFFAEGMVFYERRSEGLKSWDQGRVRWNEVGRLTEILYESLTKCLGMGPIKNRKYVSKGWSIKIE